MDLDFTAPSYYINAIWFARPENPSVIADRLGRFVDRMITLDPLLADPIFGKTARTRYADVRENLASLIAKDVTRDDWGKPFAKEGYYIGGHCGKPQQPFMFYGKVGRALPLPDNNRLSFTTDFGTWPNLSVLSYALYRSLMLAMIECWEPTVCYAQPSTLLPYIEGRRLFTEAWIAYVPPNLRHLVQPADVPIVETTPDGGLLLAATTDMFDPANPVHLDAARRIARDQGRERRDAGAVTHLTPSIGPACRAAANLRSPLISRAQSRSRATR